MRTLKARLEYLLSEQAHEISQVSPTKISREFFTNPQRTKNYNSSGATKVKVNKTNDPNTQTVLTEKMGVALKNKVEKSNIYKMCEESEKVVDKATKSQTYEKYDFTPNESQTALSPTKLPFEQMSKQQLIEYILSGQS